MRQIKTMKFHISKLREAMMGRRGWFALAVAITLICSSAVSLAVFAYNRWVDTASAVVISQPAFPVAAQSGSPNREPLAVELIILRPHGFEPREITRRLGRFMLVVNNRSGLKEMSLRLLRDTGNHLHEERVPRESLNWKKPVDLPPGHYILTDTNHPEWNCSITITAQ